MASSALTNVDAHAYERPVNGDNLHFAPLPRARSRSAVPLSGAARSDGRGRDQRDDIYCVGPVPTRVVDDAVGEGATWTVSPVCNVSGGLSITLSWSERPAVTSTLSPKSRPTWIGLSTTLLPSPTIATCEPRLVNGAPWRAGSRCGRWLCESGARPDQRRIRTNACNRPFNSSSRNSPSLQSARQVHIWLGEEGIELPAKSRRGEAHGVVWRLPAYNIVHNILTTSLGDQGRGSDRIYWSQAILR